MRAGNVGFWKSGTLRDELLLFLVFGPLDLTAGKALIEDVERARGGSVFSASMSATPTGMTLVACTVLFSVLHRLSFALDWSASAGSCVLPGGSCA
jgi:hypothetical protein